MKRIKYVYLIFGLIFFSLVASISIFSEPSNAWNNGNYTCGETYVQDPNLYNYATNYGTHDWIAESALEILYNKNPGHKFIQDLHSDYISLKKYFLFGTEVPDLRNRQFHGQPLVFIINTNCGTISYEEIRRRNHELRYVGTELQPPKALWYSAKEAGQSVSNAFREKDCQKAAFFLGAMCHFIADAAFYPHLISTTIPYTSYAHKVNLVTSNQYSSSTSKRLSEFFNIQQAFDGFTAATVCDPTWAVYYTGLDVMYGNEYKMCWFTITQYRNATWLDANAPQSDSTVPSQVGFWDLNSVVAGWDADDRPTTPGDRQDYFDTVEHNLNVAVYFCAAAINRLLGDYVNCECDGPKKTVQQSLRKWSSNYMFLFSWLSLGTLSFLMSLGLSKFMEIWVAP